MFTTPALLAWLGLSDWALTQLPQLIRTRMATVPTAITLGGWQGLIWDTKGARDGWEVPKALQRLSAEAHLLWCLQPYHQELVPWIRAEARTWSSFVMYDHSQGVFVAQHLANLGQPIMRVCSQMWWEGWRQWRGCKLSMRIADQCNWLQCWLETQHVALHFDCQIKFLCFHSVGFGIVFPYVNAAHGQKEAQKLSNSVVHSSEGLWHRRNLSAVTVLRSNKGND